MFFPLNIYHFVFTDVSYKLSNTDQFTGLRRVVVFSSPFCLPTIIKGGIRYLCLKCIPVIYLLNN